MSDYFCLFCGSKKLEALENLPGDGVIAHFRCSNCNRKFSLSYKALSRIYSPARDLSENHVSQIITYFTKRFEENPLEEDILQFLYHDFDSPYRYL